MQCSAASTVCLCVYVCVGALKCCYFWLPQGVTYAKGATTTKTNCTCHTTTTACCHPSCHAAYVAVYDVCVCGSLCVCVFVKHFTGSWPVVVVATFSSGASGVSLITYATMCINFKVAATKCCTFDFECRRPPHPSPPPLSLVAFPRIIDVYFCTVIGYYLL